VTMSDAKTQAQIWSETYMRPAARREGMAVAVAHQVMREVARRFLPPPRREPLLRTTKVSVKAIGLYKRARMLHSRSQAYDWMRTKELYEAAIREEPRFAEAWSGLSDVWIMQALMFTSSDSARAAAQAADAARRAIALQPNNAEAHSTLALLSSQRDFNLAAAEDALRRAVSADPEYVDARLNLAMVLTMRGQVEESLREFELTQQLDPAGLDLVPTEPFLYLQARRYDDARARYRELLAVNPQSQAAVWGLLFTYVAQKNWAEALTLAASIRQDKIDDVPRTEAGFQKFYGGLETYMQNGREQNRFNDYFLATYYAQIGKRDRAFEVLSRAIDTRVPVVSYIMVDPRLDSLRGDPRFNALVARLELGRPPAGP